MRLLQRLRQHVAAGHGEALALEAGIGREHHHVADLLRRLERERALAPGGDAEGAELQPRRAFADAELDATVRDEVERGEALGRAGRMVVGRDDLADAVAEPDVRRTGRSRGEEHFRRGGVAVFVKEMVLDLPRIVEAQPVGEHHLVQRFLHQPVLGALGPGPRQLQFVEDPKAHGTACLHRNRTAIAGASLAPSNDPVNRAVVAGPVAGDWRCSGRAPFRRVRLAPSVPRFSAPLYRPSPWLHAAGTGAR